MTRSIAVTFDYRCPIARNVHEAVVATMRAGSDINWSFWPFLLDQAHLEPGEPPMWERPSAERGTGVLALTWGLAVRDEFPAYFVDWHVAAFAARHDHGQRIQDEPVLHEVTRSVGLDPDAVAAVVATGQPLARVAHEHTRAVAEWSVFGVPTFIEGPHAVFVRLTERGRTDDLARVLDWLPNERINEFKRTTIPH